MKRRSFWECTQMLPLPDSPLAGQSLFGQNACVGSTTVLLSTIDSHKKIREADMNEGLDK
jgi:hypothetical protein